MPRTRSDSTTVASSDVVETDLQTGALVNTYASGPYSSWVSVITDESEGGRKAMKPCLHTQVDVSWVPVLQYHPTNMSIAPNPRLSYAPGWRYSVTKYVPSTPPVGNYIPVTGRTLNDIDDCLFQAYNQFVNSSHGLDLSQSVAEASEFPHLFNIWQRRKGIASNVTNGFLNYSFGWRPVFSDLTGIMRELKRLPKSVRRRLRETKQIVKHYKFDYSDTVNDVNEVEYNTTHGPYAWSRRYLGHTSTDKRRIVVVTIRATSKPKLTGDGQVLLDKLGRYGLIPSVATLWSITRLSFVVDWFYNIGGAIENLQGSLTQNISNVECCVTDTRTRTVVTRVNAGNTFNNEPTVTHEQKSFERTLPSGVPLLPQLKFPRNPMQYVLLGFIALVSTKGGKKILWTADRYEFAFKKQLQKLGYRLDLFLAKNKILGHGQ